MAANLYARSIFGEDALANVSIEIPVDEGPEAAVTGHIRIRAKSQVCHLLFYLFRSRTKLFNKISEKRLSFIHSF